MAAAEEHVERTWAERNQRWLSERLAFWRARVAGGATAAPMPAAPPDGFEPAVFRLQQVFALSAFETELLVLAAGVEIDAAFRASIAEAQGESPRDNVRVSFSLALGLLSQPHWDAISPVGSLRYWRLLDFDLADGAADARLRIDERILHYVTGVAAFDERLVGLAELDDAPSHPERSDRAERIAGDLATASHPLVLLVNAGADASHKRAGRALARAAFDLAGLRTLWVHPPPGGTDGAELANLARRIDREAVLAQAGVALALTPTPDGPHGATDLRLIGALRAPVIALGAPSPLNLADLTPRTLLRYTVPSVEASAPAGLSHALKQASAAALQQFRVDPALLEQALASTADLSDEAAASEQVWAALRESARGGLDALAQRIESSAAFADLVVPPSVGAQLREIASQLRNRRRVYEEWGFAALGHRGLGIAALFSGESGTGKTLAAEAIANEVRLDLYRIDLASVVSKYIGETEKNLSRVFDAAEQSGAVLLFDEADALFGKRSEVKDSHDRYANIEVAFLLQRIEAYRGLAILTTNMKSALDRAFLRRIRFVVQFPFPDEAAREEIWRRQFPDAAPVAPIDFKALARLQLSGGSIRSVALNAAFQAADRQEPIGHDAVLTAVRAEFAKLERTFTPPAGFA